MKSAGCLLLFKTRDCVGSETMSADSQSGRRMHYIPFEGAFRYWSGVIFIIFLNVLQNECVSLQPTLSAILPIE